MSISPFFPQVSPKLPLTSTHLPPVNSRQPRMFLACTSKLCWLLPITQFQSHFHILRYLIEQRLTSRYQICISQLGLPFQNAIKWGSLNNRHLLSHSSGGWKGPEQGPAESFSGKSSLLGLQSSLSELPSHYIFTWASSVHMARWGRRKNGPFVSIHCLISILIWSLIH